MTSGSAAKPRRVVDEVFRHQRRQSDLVAQPGQPFGVEGDAVGVTEPDHPAGVPGRGARIVVRQRHIRASIVPAVKITRIETLPVPMGYRDFLVCRVHTDEGIVGIGEPYPVGPNEAVAAVIRGLRHLARGTRPAGHHRDLAPPLRPLPLPRRLGGQRRHLAASSTPCGTSPARPPACRSTGCWAGSAATASASTRASRGDTPEACAEQARALVGALRLHRPEDGAPCPRTARSLPWPAPSYAGPPRAWPPCARRSARTWRSASTRTPASSSRPGRWRWPRRRRAVPSLLLRRAHPRPENVDALAKLQAQKIRIPIATGEMLYTTFGFRELLAKGGADIIQPDVCICGGLLEMKKIAAMAEAHYVSVAPHNPCGPAGHRRQRALRRQHPQLPDPGVSPGRPPAPARPAPRADPAPATATWNSRDAGPRRRAERRRHPRPSHAQLAPGRPAAT